MGQRMLQKISPGIHAREWISPATATFLAKQLAEKKSALLASWDVYILPLANPDGYFYRDGDADGEIWTVVGSNITHII